MKIIPEELTKKLNENNYPMSTGSDAWQGLKTDYEVEDDALAGTIMHENYDSIGQEKIKEFKKRLEGVSSNVENYTPKDEIEVKEKKSLQEKINIGLEIYEKIIKSFMN